MTTEAKPQIICSKTFQLFDAEGYEEHQKKNSFPLMLKPMKLTLTTTVPLNIICHMLERMNIPVISATTDYPDVVFNDPPSSPISKKGFKKFKQKYKMEQVSSSESESESDIQEVDLKAPIYPPQKKKTQR